MKIAFNCISARNAAAVAIFANITYGNAGIDERKTLWNKTNNHLQFLFGDV
jgi:hypothetical protein